MLQGKSPYEEAVELVRDLYLVLVTSDSQGHYDIVTSRAEAFLKRVEDVRQNQR